ncbi:hypothetical protein Cgig2_024424 [Carnegiea gigantea]|uniref:DUF8040 domain-containing protein n=1 Tax=Carnegiea gigantea TaxID=171969 RepID=A0A9Q1KLZ9_9CARY|nr:hypothetical protein Cgig2_024424 [Carnegiea gigantea]
MHRVQFVNFAQMDDQLEEEALVIATASTVLGAMTIFLKYYERKIVETEIEMSQIPCQSRVNRDIDRENYINSVLLCGDRHCIDQIRMSPMAFFRLCEALERKGLLPSTVNMSVKEQVLMFLHLIGHNVSIPMSKKLLTFLANEVQKGNRPNNSFKSSSYVAAANAISKKFNVKCLPEHIDNHLKTANPTHEKYLNKKIDMYDEMAVVVGKDAARGSGAKSFDDVEIHSHRNTANLEEKGDGDSEFMKDNNKQSTSSDAFGISKKSKKDMRW